MNKWEPVKNQYGIIIAVRCPVCGYVLMLYLKGKCCVICGAEMVGVNERV